MLYRWQCNSKLNVFIQEIEILSGHIQDEETRIVEKDIIMSTYDGSFVQSHMPRLEIRGLFSTKDEATLMVWEYIRGLSTAEENIGVKYNLIIKSEVFQKYIDDNPHSIL